MTEFEKLQLNITNKVYSSAASAHEEIDLALREGRISQEEWESLSRLIDKKYKIKPPTPNFKR
ncbi:hypothetical protein NME67_003232 [Proteus mirabilis]|nr:hypothetical protein [Proteus mirabilis]MBG2833276.1 hypothetical protein [Proteus mirabilis]